MKSIVLASTSTIHGGSYLEYLLEELKLHFSTTNDILFIPYARPGGITYDDYTNTAAEAFNSIGKSVKGLHEFEDLNAAITNAKSIFVGGGNTFVLVNTLYKTNTLNTLKQAITNGTPYLGTSAGSNICGLSLHTTNDMPIVYPPSFKTLGIVPFNINPHYLDPNPNSTHMGETRETRIKEFHSYNTQPVIGLREGSWISIKDTHITLKGNLEARIFEHNKSPYELAPNSDLSFLK